MINIVTYNPIFYKDAVKEILSVRHLDTSWVDHLPSLGYVAVYVDEHAEECAPSKVIACGFIREAEGNLQIMESFATHPDASALDRHNALDGITEKLISRAEAMKAKLICLTADSSIIDRAKAHKLNPVPYVVLVKQ